MASPLITALKHRYPNAEVHWLAESFLVDMLESDPLLQSVIAWPKGRWLKLYKGRQWRLLWREVVQFKKQLKGHGFDLVLDVQGLVKSGVLAKFTGAKRIVSFKSKEPTKWLVTERIEKPANAPLISSEYRAMAEYLGCDVSQFPMQLHVSDINQQFVSSYIKHQQLGDYVVVCPFTTRPQKHWSNRAWRTLIETLIREYGLKVVVIGGPQDQENAKAIIAGLSFAHQLCGQASLNQSIGIIKQAKLCIGVDTGMTHAGLAVNVPTIAIFGSTRPYLDTGDHLGKVLYLDKSCSPCRRNPTCDGKFSCMTDITAELVMSEVGSLINAINIKEYIA